MTVYMRNLSTSGLANTILGQAHFARDASSSLYVYKDGFYQPGEWYVRQQVKALFKRFHREDFWNSGRAEEVIEYIAVDAPELWRIPPSDVINLQNGLLNVITRELVPHSQDFLSLIQLPVKYDPQAAGFAWRWFVSETFPHDSQDIAWEIPAWAMTPEHSLQTGILLTGEGANGKSVYLAALWAFLGKRNISGVPLQKLESDRFAAARLVGKLANICADLPSAKLVGTSTFKAITGGDALHAERKFKPSFEFTPYCKLIFSANQPPPTEDATFAFFRRWVVVPFLRTFEEGDAATLPRSELDAMLSDPYELSTLLNLALNALPRLRSNGFTVSETIKSAGQEFRHAIDPFQVWLEQHTVEDPEGVIPKRDLIENYKAVCVAAKRTPMTDTAFGRALRRARPSLTDGQVKGQEVYRGIEWRPISL